MAIGWAVRRVDGLGVRWLLCSGRGILLSVRVVRPLLGWRSDTCVGGRVVGGVDVGGRLRSIAGGRSSKSCRWMVWQRGGRRPCKVLRVV